MKGFALLLVFIASPVLVFTQVDSLLQNVQEQLTGVKEQPVKKDNTTTLETPAETISGVKDNVGSAYSTLKKILSPTKILTILFILFAVWMVNKFVVWFFGWAVKRFSRNRLKILRLRPVINILVWFIAVYILVVTVINPTGEAITAALASSAIALGFAAQDILKNLFGGFIIILEKPFQLGDRIQIGDSYGEVKNIGLRATQIQTLDDSLVTIPNAKIVSEGVSNANSGALDCMVVVDLYLPVDVNVEKVRKVAYESAITSRFINIDKPVQILFFDQFDNRAATNVKVKAYVLDALYEKAFAGDVTETAKKAFKELNIYN